ncbi:MAG TPA: diadenylate cyclase CdaA [Polyangiaceae bacterium]|nr:diadenylate cyclase CdaA [Polyangiaceae bacterium]
MLGSLYEYFVGRPALELLRDFVDVASVYYLAYRALLVLRGTRAMQVGIGLFLVFVLYVVSAQLHLVTLLSVLGALIPGAAILILVVVFQNDIRRGLMRMGSQPWFGFAKTRERQAIDEVVEAATELAKHRMGAIITFEQDANLDEFVGANKGHELDAAVSSELLVSIFVPEGVNKLHDGAVIIRDLRIAKAGVFFPMPDSRVLDPSFGSRHRAALGITEETDAVVVVVSEERGTIGFCFNGNIVGNLDGPGLRKALEGVFSPRRRRSGAKAPVSKRSEALASQRTVAETATTPPRATVVAGVGRPRDGARPAPAEDSTLVSVPPEAGETPTTRIRTTESDLEPVPPPVSVAPPPLRKTKVEKEKAPESVSEPVLPGTAKVPKIAPLTTPMRAPATPLKRSTTDQSLPPKPPDDQSTDGADGSGAT